MSFDIIFSHDPANLIESPPAPQKASSNVFLTLIRDDM